MNPRHQKGKIIIENNALFQLYASRICLQTDYNIIIIGKECEENEMDDGKWIKMIILDYGEEKRHKKKEERQLPDEELKTKWKYMSDVKPKWRNEKELFEQFDPKNKKKCKKELAQMN